MSAQIFVSYRRGSSSHAAARLAGDLQSEFGEDSVYFDVCKHGLGERWPSALEDGLRDANMLIVVISDDWLGETPGGPRRIDDPEDWVRREVESGLPAGTDVLPIFINLTKMPDVKNLPESIAGLFDLQGMPLRHLTWNNDLDPLVEWIEKRTGQAAWRRSIPPYRRGLSVFANELRGREEELQRLDEVWDTPNDRILTVVAWGGLGKTSLVAHWRDRLQADKGLAPALVYEWSFHKQGETDEAASADDFFHEALQHFERDGDPGRFRTPEAQGQRLADLIGRYRTLLILDGIESLQFRSGEQEGELEDPALKALINGLSRRNRGLCVITTRMRVENLVSREDLGAPRMELTSLSAEAGALLLKDFGARGTEKELRKVSEGFGGHALALMLLAGYLRVAFKSDVSRWREVPLLDQGGAQIKGAGQARRILESYEQWLEGKDSMVSVLLLVGLYNRTADPDSLTGLRSNPVIDGLTDAIAEDASWNQAVEELEALSLVTSSKNILGRSLDAHPLVREYYAEQLAEKPELAREAHRRLFEHFSKSAPDQPQTMQEMMPLLFAVAHGCRAGQYDKARAVYWDRCRRGNKRFLSRGLGAQGADLVALRNFIPGVEPVEHLDDAWNARLLGVIASNLRSLGRLPEAGAPAQAALQIAESIEDWLTAAIQAGNLCEFDLTLGKLRRAITHGEHGVELARRSENTFLVIGNVAALTHALHLAGEKDAAWEQFEYAESLWAELRAQEAALKAPEEDFYKDFAYCDVSEYDFCGLLIAEKRYDEAEMRCRRVLDDRRPYHGNLHVALAGLSLASALLARDGDASDQAVALTEEGVEEFERSGVQQYLARCLVFRAKLNASQDPHAVFEDLKRAALIAQRGQMRIVLADVLLSTAAYELSGVLERDQGQVIIDQASGEWGPGDEGARPELGAQALQDAKILIQASGYEWRADDLRKLEAKIALQE